MAIKLTKDTKVWDALLKNIKILEKDGLQVGWFSGDNYGPENGNVSKAYIARITEEGHINGSDSMIPGAVTPPRPYMRVGYKNFLKSSASIKTFNSVIESVLKGGSALVAFEKVSPYFVEGLKQVMRDWDTPRNAPLTVELKGFDNPLYESGELIASVDARVERKGKS